jgi:hypothetical protein
MGRSNGRNASTMDQLLDKDGISDNIHLVNEKLRE